MSVRESFVALFGEDEAARIEEAALSHHPNDNHGSDPFKWATSICIGFGCLKKYRKDHGFVAPYEDVRQWIIDSCDLGSHDGDFDYLAAFCGSYDEFIKKTSCNDDLAVEEG